MPKSDMDFNDLQLDFTRQTNGDLTIKIAGYSAGLRYNLIGPDGKVLPGFENISGSTQATATGNSFDASYGMNVMAHRVPKREDKVLVLDYNVVVANVTGTTPTGLATWSKDIAPRHSGACNVLYMDGSVRSAVPFDIDPTVTAKQAKFWSP
jgi:prepilin-type processing-associated H-X9-DG protein